MIKIAVYICRHTVLSSLTMAQDCFNVANQLAGQRLFQLSTISDDGLSVPLKGLSYPVEGDLARAADADLLLVPAIGAQPLQTIKQNSLFIEWLRQHPQLKLASLCSAAFMLAAAGVLNGHKATTHWHLADSFQQTFPQVKLAVDQLVTHDNLRFCSGGAQAGLDLCLYLVQLFQGDWLARQVASMLVMEYGRGSQRRFVPRLPPVQQQDIALARLQRWLEQHYAQHITLDHMAQQLHCSPRTVIRRFKEATQLTPYDYLQRVRISAAESLLAQDRLGIDEIATRVGYDDRTAFAKLFKQMTGETPAMYRRRFWDLPDN
ncbi:GlxA family transcriptional regulator [Agitococcus lubricus]|nr:helix-turn-helix domain-containing protein [Agitococcus lubricus]